MISKLRQAVEILCHVKSVSAANFPLSVATLLGIAGFLFALKDGKVRNFRRGLPWSSDQESPPDHWVVSGLQNLGNNCFLNVILQGLASCSSFKAFLENILEEFESLSNEERAECLPLATALASLIEELCAVQHRQEVLSPRKLMHAMGQYIPSFNLTSQQDAEEAFFHLVSSLREELAECYAPNVSSLADMATFDSCRILTPARTMGQSEQQRWQQSFLGPFDGILGSFLTCQSCSFQISLDFQYFHSLHLPPVLGSSGSIMLGCSVEDCLKQFFVAEHLDNYHCSHCWHDAAIKYLSLQDGNQTDIAKLRHCSKQDSCDCKNLSHLRSMPWSNSFSHTFKQLSIARCPKILCLHMQRASVNVFGELVKLQGHVSFPLILDLSPFITSGVGINNWQEKFPTEKSKQQYKFRFPYISHVNIQLDPGAGNDITGPTGQSICSEAVATEVLGQGAFHPLVNTYKQALQEKPSSPETSMSMQSEIKVCKTLVSRPSEPLLYHLVSVVQHFGRPGSGHYIVYRRVGAELRKIDIAGPSNSSLARWFCISDSEVLIVPEKDVLAAEASLLFYERIQEG